MPIVSNWPGTSSTGHRYYGKWQNVEYGDHVLPLEYQMKVGRLTPGPSGSRVDVPNNVNYTYPVSALNAAYDRLVENMSGTQGNIALLLAEWSQTTEAIYQTANQVRKGWKNLRRGRLKNFGKLKLRDPASEWLKGNYGLLPAAGDIYNLSKQFSEQTPVWSHTGVGKFHGDNNVGGSVPFIRKYTGKVYVGCKARVKNPNLYLFQQLGLVNPAALVWELIPFSFVVDWFLDVGGYLNSLSDFLGLEVSHGYTTVLKKYYLKQTWPPSFGLTTEGKAAAMFRAPGAPSPKIGITASGGLDSSWRRAANALALAMAVPLSRR